MNLKEGSIFFQKMLILFLCEAVIFTSINVSINILNHWVIYIFVLSFQFNSITFLAIIDEVKINAFGFFWGINGRKIS